MGAPIISVMALAGVLVVYSPAGATTSGSLSVPTCTATQSSGHCIAGVSADYTASTITLGLTAGVGTDPTTDPNWDPSKNHNGASGVGWAIFVDGSATPSWGVVAYDVDNLTGPPTFTGAVVSLSNSADRTCYGSSQVTTSFDAGTHTYNVSFAPDCVGDPTSIAVEALLEYNDGSTIVPTQYIDQQPVGGVNCCAVSSPNPIPASQHGYWLVGSDGGIFSFGAAQFFGSTAGMRLQRPVVGMTPTADHGGYWLVASDGGIFTFGDAGFYGSIPQLGLAPPGSSSPKRLNAPIVGMVPSDDGNGYFLVASDGGVFTFGGAKFEGSCPGIGGCSGAVVAVVPDASGNGYWLVTATGHVYAFGDAVNYGAPGSQAVPVTAAVRTTDGAGYWILLANGTVDAYGDANNLGSPLGVVGGSNPADAIFTTADGAGYWVASANGSVYAYGDAPIDGGVAALHLNGSIIAAVGM